jgi:hypothetical protein
MSRNWRQVRVFTRHFQPDWYHDLLWEIVRPWLAEQRDVDYYFSRYRGPLFGTKENPPDNADICEGPDAKELTEILPDAFREKLPGDVIFHRSLRLRFVDAVVEDPTEAPKVETPSENPWSTARPCGPVEKSLRSLVGAQPGRFWFGGFLDYKVRNDLGGNRFSPFDETQVAERNARGELVAAVLKANCQLVLASFNKGDNGFEIEPSNNSQNLIFGTAFQSVGHMLANVWWDNTGERPSVWAMDHRRGFGTNI